MAGQELVLTLLTALAASPLWKKSLLVIVYDEHGGFFDHVDPRTFTPEDDRPTFRRYGVRVPALVVSPFVDPGVSHTVFDHTSLLKTILLRFCEDPEAAIKAMGRRVMHANHLGQLLTRSTARPRPRPPERVTDALVDTVAEWRQETYRRTLLEPAPAGAGRESLTELQDQVVAAALRLRREGLQPGTP
jgi:phospholipase C